MDKIINLLGERGAGVFLVKPEREKKKLAERTPKPEKKINLDSWILDIEKATESELEAKAKSIVSSSNVGITEMWSEDLFKDALRKKVMALPVGERKQLLPLIQKYAEAEIYARSLDKWNHRFDEIDSAIRGYESTFPKPFDIGMMNTNVDYPKERIGFADNQPYDRWLTDELKEKRPVFFSPHDRWLEKLAEFYEKVYLVEYQREQDLLRPPVAQKVEPTATPQPEPISPAMREFFAMGEETLLEEDGLTPSGRRRSRVYK